LFLFNSGGELICFNITREKENYTVSCNYFSIQNTQDHFSGDMRASTALYLSGGKKKKNFAHVPDMSPDFYVHDIFIEKEHIIFH
jgi:hypothetical protein